jgi:superfamily II DNA or RNA helicase
MAELRPYQEDTIFHMVNSLLDRECICLPTGAGKTVVFTSYAAAMLAENKRGLIVVNRIELLNQTAKTFYKNYGITPSLITAKSKNLSVNGIYLAMVETLFRRKKILEFLETHCDYIIIDECHRGEFNKLLPNFKKVLGFSATPVYVKKGDCLANYYKNLYTPIQVNGLIEQKFLCDADTYAPKALLDKSQLKLNASRTDYDERQMGDILSGSKYVNVLVSYVQKFCEGKKTIIYNANIQHSITICATLRSRGFNAYHLDGEMSEADRNFVLGKLATEDNCIISNVNILTFGFDCPEIEVIILNRATKSLSLYLQMCGRGSRLSNIITKNKFTILDLCGNSFSHGLWQQDREWDVLFNKIGSDKEGIAPIKECPSCFLALPIQAKQCPECVHIFINEEAKEVQEIDPELVKIEAVKKHMFYIMDRVKQNGNSKYRAIHLIKEKIFKENSNEPLEYMQGLILQALPDWCKENEVKNNQWHKDFCTNEMEKYYKLMKNI